MPGMPPQEVPGGRHEAQQGRQRQGTAATAAATDAAAAQDEKVNSCK